MTRPATLDVAVTNAGSGTVSVLINDGDGTLSGSVSHPASAYPAGIGVADFDGNGHPDVAVASSGGAAVLLHA